MPKLIRLYIRNVLIGFALSAIFVTALLYTNVGNLWHLISGSDIGWIAFAMLFMFNGLVFAGVQFAFVIMRMEYDDDEPRGGRYVPDASTVPVRVEVVAKRN